MLSKDIFDEFLAPYYHQIVPELKKRSIVPFVDSDGDIMPLIPWLKEVGIEGILPLERMAGVDVCTLREKHPDFKLIGAFDKTIMCKGKDAMRAEFERLLPVMKQGGFVASVDHQTPPDVSLQQYHEYIELLSEYSFKSCENK
jgi:uroporphyrinogen-III decarboxylase